MWNSVFGGLMVEGNCGRKIIIHIIGKIQGPIVFNGKVRKKLGNQTNASKYIPYPRCRGPQIWNWDVK